MSTVAMLTVRRAGAQPSAASNVWRQQRRLASREARRRQKQNRSLAPLRGARPTLERLLAEMTAAQRLARPTPPQASERVRA